MTYETSGEEFCLGIIEVEKGKRMDFLVSGRNLSVIQDEKLYKPRWKSFAEFCRNFPRSQAYVSSVMGIHRILVVRYGFSPERLSGIGMATLSCIVPNCRTREDAEALVAEAEKLTREDLRTLLRSRKLSTVDNNLI